MSNALSLGVCFLILGRLGAFTPDFPGVPVYDFLNLSGPIAMCGETTVAILPADVAPAVATSFKLIDIISVIFILLFIFISLDARLLIVYLACGTLRFFLPYMSPILCL